MRKLLIIAAVVMAFAAPIFAQSSFSDVPRDHWAYDAVYELEQLGLVVGYPDGTFKGKRTLTRYEFAMVISRLLPFLGDTEINVDGFLKKSDLDGYAKKSDIPNFKDADLSPYAQKSALDKIAKLVGEFQAELAALGVDVNVLKADVAALKSRVSALEEEQARVKIYGDINLSAKGQFGDDYLMDIDGRIARDGERHAIFQKDIQLDVVGKVNNNINAYVTLVMGDYMAENLETTVLPYYMYVQSKDEKWGDVTVGRMPFQINEYVVKRADNDTFTDIARLDNGDYVYEGVNYAKNFKNFGLRLWGTTPWAQGNETDDWFDSNLFNYNSLGVINNAFVRTPYMYNFDNGLGHNDVHYDMGGQLSFNFGGVTISGLWSQVATQAKTPTGFDGADKADIYGGTIDAIFGNFGFGGDYYVQNLNRDPYVFDPISGTDVLMGKKDAAAWNAYLQFKNDNVYINGGYKEIDAGYATPGAWDKIANLYNPDNIKGFWVDAAVKFGIMSIYGGYKDYDIKDDFYGRPWADGITNWKAGAKFAFTDLDTVYAEYESAKYDIIDSTFITAAWMRKVGTNANFKLMYQYADNDMQDTKGSIVSAQVGVNF